MYGINKINKIDKLTYNLKYKVEQTIPFHLYKIFYKIFIILLILFEIFAPIMIYYSFGTNKNKDIANNFLLILILLHIVYMTIRHSPQKENINRYKSFITNLSSNLKYHFPNNTVSYKKFLRDIGSNLTYYFPKDRDKDFKIYEDFAILGGLLLLRTNLIQIDCHE
jgi:hypothetical protein